MLSYVVVLVLTHAMAQITSSCICTLSTQIFFWEASPINQNMLLHCLHGFFERYHLQTWRISQKTQQMCGVFIGVAVFASLLSLQKSSCCTETTCIPWKSNTLKIPLKKIIVPGDLFFVIGIFHQTLNRTLPTDLTFVSCDRAIIRYSGSVQRFLGYICQGYIHIQYTLLKPPENGWLEDDPFLLG